MIKRLTLLFLLLCSSAQAKPHWKRIAFKVATEGLAFAIQSKGADHCLRGDPERCFNGYGNEPGRLNKNFFRTFSLGVDIGLIAASEKCSNDGGPKPACYGLAYGVPAMQAALGVHDYLNYQKEKKP